MQEIGRDGVGGTIELRQTLTELADEYLPGLGLELVDLELEFSGRRRIVRFFVDRPGGGVNVDDCAKASRTIGWEMEEREVLESGYVLQVSSPGLDRRIARPRDFQKFTGSELTLRLRQPIDGRRKFAGRLLSADERGIELGVGEDVIGLRYDQIQRANLVYDGLERSGDGTGPS